MPVKHCKCSHICHSLCEMQTRHLQREDSHVDLSPLMTDACIWAQVTNWSLCFRCSVAETRCILSSQHILWIMSGLLEGSGGGCSVTRLCAEGGMQCMTPRPGSLKIWDTTHEQFYTMQPWKRDDTNKSTNGQGSAVFLVFPLCFCCSCFFPLGGHGGPSLRSRVVHWLWLGAPCNSGTFSHESFFPFSRKITTFPFERILISEFYGHSTVEPACEETELP